MTNAMSPNEIDLHVYASPMRLEANRGITLADQLAAAAPADLTDRGRAALALVGQKAEAVAAVITSRTPTTVGGLRPVLSTFDAAWGALYGRLVSAAKLPPAVGNIAARADAIIGAVLIEGTGFLQTVAETRYAQSRRRLAIIADKRLEAEIDQVAGAGFLDAVKIAHRALGDAVGTGATPLRLAGAELHVAVTELSIAVADYGLQLAAQVTRGDAESVARFRAAALPMDRYRADSAEAGGNDDQDDDLAPIVVTTPNGMPTPGPFTQ